MRVKQSNRLPQEKDPQVARRAVQKVVKRSHARTATPSEEPSQKFATVIQDLAVQRPRKGGEEEPSWFIAEASKLNPALFHKHIEALGLSEANVICPDPHQKANRPGGAYCTWSRHHVHAGATLPLHTYFRSVADYFNVSPFHIAPNGIQALSALYILYFLHGWDEPTPHESNAGTELVTDQLSPGPSPLFRRPGDLIIREPEPQHRSAIPARSGKGKAIQVERELSSSSDDEDEFVDQILNADPNMFRQCIASSPKRKAGDGSGSMPPRKIPKVVPPNRGRQPEGSTTLPPLAPSSLSSSASLTPPGPPGPSKALRAADTKLRGSADQTLRDASTIQSFESLPWLSVDPVLDRGIAQLTHTLMTFCHAQQRSVNYKELIKVLNDQLVEAQAKVETLIALKKDSKSKLEQAEKTVAERDESLRRLSDENQQQAQTNQSLSAQLEKLTLENKELARENEGLVSENEELKQKKEFDLIRFEEASFDCFYQVWKLNKPLKLDFFTKEVQAEELARCEARAAEEAANPPGPTPASSTLSFRARGAAEAEEGVDQPTREARQ
ncbi:uncharacterized protein LOC133815758 [Humulus lupulus]|uniref:uncharacterized protein LOC133815758 n=1 Tax=Humulus lupulus TaxID=3486 RepID=UPI002B411D2B|nr:uncharacterized protein LOC133815758 [Humulus lupulus]